MHTGTGARGAHAHADIHTERACVYRYCANIYKGTACGYAHIADDTRMHIGGCVSVWWCIHIHGNACSM